MGRGRYALLDACRKSSAALLARNYLVALEITQPRGLTFEPKEAARRCIGRTALRQVPIVNTLAHSIWHHYPPKTNKEPGFASHSPLVEFLWGHVASDLPADAWGKGAHPTHTRCKHYIVHTYIIYTCICTYVSTYICIYVYIRVHVRIRHVGYMICTQSSEVCVNTDFCSSGSMQCFMRLNKTKKIPSCAIQHRDKDLNENRGLPPDFSRDTH